MLIAGGDSFTWGDELPDCDGSSPSKLTWASLLAKDMGLGYNCVARPGTGNKTIARRVIQAVDRNPEVKYVAVMWSYPARYDISLRQDIVQEGKKSQERYDYMPQFDDSWLTLSPYRALSFDERMNKFPRELQQDPWFIEKINGWYRFEQDSGIGSLNDQFLGMISKEHYTQESLTNIFCLQSFLKEKNIPYTFCSCNNQLLELITSNFPLAKSIDTTLWQNVEQGFVEWAKDNQYAISEMGHPGPDAHAHWFHDKYQR